MIEKIKSTVRSPLGWLRLILLLSVVPLMLLSYDLIAALLVVGLLVTAMPLRDMGLITRCILTAVVLISANTVIGFFTWTLKIPFTIEGAILCYATATALLIFLNPAPPKLKLFQREEIIALSGAVICMGVLLLPLLSQHNSVALIRVIGNGVDNIAHLSLIRSIEAHHNYLEGDSSLKEHEVLKNITAYPQGFHLNAALFDQLISPVDGARSVRQSLSLFMTVIVACYGLLFYLFIYGSLHFSRRLNPRVTSRTLSGFIAVLVAAFLFLAVLFGMYRFGFQAQICALALLLALLIVLAQGAITKLPNEKRVYLGIAALISAGIGFVYLYVWPLAFGALCFFIAKVVQKGPQIGRKTWMVFAPLIFVNFAPAFLYLQYSDRGVRLDETGGAVILNSFVLLGAFVIAALYLRKKRTTNPEVGMVIMMLNLSLLFAIFIYFYQRWTVGGESRYYFFKATYPVAILVGFAGVALLTGAINGLRKHIYKVLASMALLCVFCANLAPLTNYLKKPYVFSKRYAALIIRMSNSPKFLRESTKVIGIGNNNEDADDMRLMRLLGAFSGKGNAAIEEIELYGFWPHQRLMAYSLIKKYQLQQSDGKLFIITGDKSVKAALIKNAGPHAQNLTFIDPNTSDPLEGLCQDIPCTY